MIEIDLSEFEDYYLERINVQFLKVRKATKRLIADIRGSLIDIKVCMDHFLGSADKIDQKSLRSLNLFSDRVKGYVDEIEIPEEDEISYSNLMDMISSIKKLFKSINEIARKSLPKFQKEVQSEIKELNYRTRKLQKKQAILDTFLRKKYGDVKSAEDLLKKVPKLFTLKENIQNTKADLEDFENLNKEIKEELEKFNSELINIEKNVLFSELDDERDKLFKLKIKINDEIRFKKALKKFKFELDKGAITISNIDLNYLRDFLKDPVKILIKESKDLPKFSALLIHLRRIIEESHKLNLKTEIRDKTIEQINKIFDDKVVHENIEKYKEIKGSIDEIEKKVKDAGLTVKLENIKNQISSKTAKLEHIQTDLNRKNNDYLRYLGALKEERVIIQNLISNILEEEIKINIVFEF